MANPPDSCFLSHNSSKFMGLKASALIGPVSCADGALGFAELWEPHHRRGFWGTDSGYY